MHTQEDNWEKEFDEEFPEGTIGHKHDQRCEWTCVQRPNLKSFIKRTRQEAYTKGRSDEAKTCAGCSKEKLTETYEKNKEVADKYQELIMAVENKYEGETRHETALRLIKLAHVGDARAASAPKQT